MLHIPNNVIIGLADGDEETSDSIDRQKAIDVLNNAILMMKIIPSVQSEITLEKAVRIVLDFIQSAPGTTTLLTMPDGTTLNTDWGYVEEGLTEIVNYFKGKKNE